MPVRLWAAAQHVASGGLNKVKAAKSIPGITRDRFPNNLEILVRLQNHCNILQHLYTTEILLQCAAQEDQVFLQPFSQALVAAFKVTVPGLHQRFHTKENLNKSACCKLHWSAIGVWCASLDCRDCCFCCQCCCFCATSSSCSCCCGACWGGEDVLVGCPPYLPPCLQFLLLLLLLCCFWQPGGEKINALAGYERAEESGVGGSSNKLVNEWKFDCFWPAKIVLRQKLPKLLWEGDE